MTDHSETPEPRTSPTRAGALYAVLAAVSAALLLFLPVLLLGVSMSVVAAVARGEGLAWQSVVGMTYAFVGIPGLLALLLLFIPYAWFRAAGRRLGTRRAIRWVGGLLVAWQAGVALLWAGEAMSGPTPAMKSDEIWYAIAFATAAVVVLISIVVAERKAVRAAIALVGGLAVALVALVVMLVAVWGTPPRIAADAQVVHVVVTRSEVRLDPATVHGGEVHFMVEGADDPAEHAGFTFVSAGYGQGDTPLPLSDAAVARLAHGDYQGTGLEGGWGSYAVFTLREGKYAFLTGPDQPGVPPHSIAVLEVLP